MRRAPKWLERLVDARIAAGTAALWWGPALRMQTAAPLSASEDGEGPYGALWLAALEGEELLAELRALRPRLAPGADIHLLLPEPPAGVAGKVGRWFDPLGRRGRRAHDVAAQCAALLGIGAVDVGVERWERRATRVHGRLPDPVFALDGCFADA